MKRKQISRTTKQIIKKTLIVVVDADDEMPRVSAEVARPTFLMPKGGRLVCRSLVLEQQEHINGLPRSTDQWK